MQNRPATKNTIYCLAIISICYLYAGSAYMSQFYRLMDHFDERMVDIITSGINYLLQAAGIGLFSLGLRISPRWFDPRKLFIVSLITGLPFMFTAQFAHSGSLIMTSGFIFQLHIGIYLGYYLSLLAISVSPSGSGLIYGTAYAIGSLGTYLLSLPRDGAFLTSRPICLLYTVLALTAALLTLSMVEKPETAKKPKEIEPEKPIKDFRRQLLSLSCMIAVMTLISVMGSGLFYSFPPAKNVNWNLIRAFYAGGLILSGFLMDKSRKLGGICTVASLTYPLIAIALAGEDITGTVSLSLSYFFRGFLSVYYVTSFTDLSSENRRHLPVAPLGLLVSRITEALLTFLLTYMIIPLKGQLILTALFFAPLIIFYFLTQTEKEHSPSSEMQRKKDALFAEKYGLTAREAQVLDCLCKGMSDKEIAECCFISKNTVRFHVSNLLKKLGAASRVEAIRAHEKF